MSDGCRGGLPLNDGRCPTCYRPYGECQPSPASGEQVSSVEKWNEAIGVKSTQKLTSTNVSTSENISHTNNGELYAKDIVQPAPREWSIQLHPNDNSDLAYAWKLERVPRLKECWPNNEFIHVVEKSALTELQAKYNFMVDSAQQNARERDAAQAKLAEQAANCISLFLHEERMRAVQAEVERLRKINHQDGIVGSHEHLAVIKERDALKEKCERLEQALTAWKTRFQSLRTMGARRKGQLIKWKAHAVALAGAAQDNIGPWMSAALDDDKVCAEMKADIQKLFNALAAFEKFKEGK